MRTHHISEEVSVAQLLQVQQVGSSGGVESLCGQTVQDRLHHGSVCVRRTDQIQLMETKRLLLVPVCESVCDCVCV